MPMTLDTDGRFVGRYWWHDAILEELQRARTLGQDGYPVAGIAGNLRGFTRSDTRRYVLQLIEWGELEECDPSWEFDDLWVKLR